MASGKRISSGLWLRWSLLVLMSAGGMLIPSRGAQTQSTGTCPLKLGYWRDHPEAWPRSTLVLGDPSNPNHTYTQSELLNLLMLSGRSDASIILAKQLIATKLNIFNGTNPAPIESAVRKADSLLAGFPGKLPYGTRLASPMGLLMTTVAIILDAYNSGWIPDSCGSENIPPLSNAGPDQTVFVGAVVQLDGSASSDADGNPLTYRWNLVSRPSDSQAALSDPNAVTPSFVADESGSYEVSLIVNDGRVDSDPDSVVISTANSKPVAGAGPDQTVLIGARVLLDGRGSYDVDGDPLTYRWNILGRPEGSVAALDDDAVPQPSFIADHAGSYTIELIVNDGKVDSDSDTVVVTTENSKPVADAGPDQAVSVGDTVQVDGSGSTDADGDPLTYFWSLTTVPAGSTAALTDPAAVSPTFVADVAGLYVVQLIVNDGKIAGEPDTVSITASVPVPVNRPPVAVDDSALTAAGTPITITVLGNDSDPDGDPISITATTQGTNGSATYDTASVTYTPNAGFHGIDAFSYTISDGRGGTATATVTVAVDQPPQVNAGQDLLITLPAAATLSGAATDDGLPNPPGTATVTWSALSGPGAVTFADAGVSGTTASFSEAGIYVLRLTADDGFLTATDDVQITVNPPVDTGLPPDPATVAPPIDRSVATTLQAATEFLYTGSNPIQTGVAPGTIEARRAAVLRGKVMDRSNAPLPRVLISILGHPEFGQTLSRADGMFDLAVNGGGLLTIDYTLAGYLPSQRRVNVPWQDYAVVPDVVLIPLDTLVSVIDLAASLPIQVARGSVSSDADGTRQATLLFPQGTTAEMILPGGGTQSLSSLSVRATEYTVGANGPQAMPGDLPPTSGYTYAVELSADEALAAGATEVRFSNPLPFYVENFLNFPVGTTVPSGSYDRARGVWVPAESGKVIKIVSSTGGFADLDVDGDGLADSGSALTALSITDAERQQLALLYQPGLTLWRVLIPHFTPWDLNWPFGPPPDAVAPAEDPEPGDEVLCLACTTSGSIIEIQNQVLGEAVDIVGAPFRLHYLSDRVPGRKAKYSVDIPLSGPQIPASLLRIELEVRAAGRIIRQSFGPAINQRTAFTWDGRDGYGRTLQGTQPISIWIGYTYPGVYGIASSFGYNGSGLISGNSARQEVTLWRPWQGTIGAWDARAAGLGGWTLSANHAYDPKEVVVHRGDGVRRSIQNLGPTIHTVAGTGFSCPSQGDPCGDGGPATEARTTPKGLAFGPDGSLYIADAQRVRRVWPDGIIRNVAGNGFACSGSTLDCGDGGLATQALVTTYGLAVAPDGSIYIADGISRIRKVTPDGIIRTIAGTVGGGYSGDGGPANLAQLSQPTSLALGPDGSLYIADHGNWRIRRIGPDGIISTVAGIGVGATCSAAGDGGPATLARLCAPEGIAVGEDGSVYIADTANSRIRRVTPDGIIRTIAGTGVQGFTGDGGLATQARLSNPTAVAVGGDGSVYVADSSNNRVRWFRPGGFINTLAGTGLQGTSGDGGLASRAAVQFVRPGLAVGPDRGVYFGQTSDNTRVRRVEPVAPQPVPGEIAVPSEDGAEVYLFAPNGHHLRTMDAITGALRYQFAYDGAGRLSSVTDTDGNVTTIQRDGSGNPTAIVGPFGQSTTLAVTADGYLSQAASPAGENISFVYTADGLLTSLTNPRGHTSGYTFDGLGRLTSATDPTGAIKTLSSTGTSKDYTVALTTALGRTTTYRVERLSNGSERRTTIDPAGKQSQVVRDQNGTRTATHPDGTTVTITIGPDPRWGMLAPLAASVVTTTPGGKVHTTTTQRTVTLSNTSDVLSLATLTETTTINGTRTYTTNYDGPSRTLALTSPEGRRGSAVLDARGRVVQNQLGDLEPITYAYDSRGRTETVTQGTGPGARVTRYAYGTDGLLASVTDPLSRTTSLAKDAAGRVVAMTLSDGRLAGFAYDSDGNVVGRTPPGRLAHNFAFNQRDELSAYTPPDVGGLGGETRYTSDADRRLARVDRPDGQTVGFGYDAAGRLDLLDLASGDRTYAYDAAGRPATLGAPEVSLAFAYDGSLLTGATWGGPVAGSVTRAYDDNLRVTALGVNGDAVALQYDRDNLRTLVGELALTRSAQTGLVTGTGLLSVTDTTTYDGFAAAAGYMASYGGTSVFSQAYTRDALGRLTSMSETISGATRVYSYTYDLAGHLAEVRVDGTPAASYTYDANGNRASFTGPGGTLAANCDAQDRLLLYGATIYTHTANGEISNKTDTATGASTAYRYDTLGNLTGATLPDSRQVEYLLDGRGRRVGKRIGNTLVQGFLYQDGLRPIAELDVAGNVVSRFVYAGSDGAPDYLVRNGVTYRVITDHIGSVRLVLDAATGEVTQRTDYDEFGIVKNETVAPGFQPVPFGFAGGLYDRDTGLVHFGAREYDPETGRWTRKDPIGFGGGDLNLYAYAGDDPVNYIDPSGLVAGKSPFPPDSVEAAIAAEGAALGAELAGAGIIGSEAAAGGVAAAGGEAAVCPFVETVATSEAAGGIFGSASVEASLAAQYDALVAGELTLAESEALLAEEFEFALEAAVRRELASSGHIRMLFELLSKIVK
jgi:RHS repeat-associated protein